ncbi:hypothetical protein LOC68_02115 [Blastopirellula sp. JC732]|uniref:Uncharacterized protein n=1 Tax=Blastopirellula sediminis TaxID=2894196 RepID=A0A9X1SEX1_9BACT|nr:hypothetical protein [Blastopirellula sediminis]MCC9608015.1 hypothetical protein [Blastopirellula sediminis]MCC9627192.1 hypothetical protein [Blastopirellula sediminis]
MKSPTLRRILKVFVSVVILAHFAAVLLAGFGIGTHSHPAPEPLAYAHAQTCHYLRPLQLDAPWHFYAPNPGSGGVLYVAMETDAGRQVWRQWFNESQNRLVEPYIRSGGVASAAAGIEPSGPDFSRYLMTRQGEICLGSLARRFARDFQQSSPNDEKVVAVSFYLLSGNPMTPQDARSGMAFGDLRLYTAIAAGHFTPAGDRFESIAIRNVEMPNLVFGILQATRRGANPAAAADNIDIASLPGGIRTALESHPEWLELPPADLRREIERHFMPKANPPGDA